MSSKFIQGNGYPTLYRYNGSDVLQETVAMPRVRDDGNNSFIKQTFVTYPDNETRQYPLLSGTIGEDKPVGINFKCQIKYNSIKASDLLPIFNCILACDDNSGHYLKLAPRSDNNGTVNTFKVLFKGDIILESANMWKHNVTLDFVGTDLLDGTLVLVIPPVIP